MVTIYGIKFKLFYYVIVMLYKLCTFIQLFHSQFFYYQISFYNPNSLIIFVMLFYVNKKVKTIMIDFKENSLSINTFIDGIIDYAGLFPPANLNLFDSLSNYLNYIKTNKYNLLSSFVLPINLIDDFIPTLEKIGTDYSKLDISFVATKPNDAINFIDSIKSDMDKINSLVNKNDKIYAKAIEITLPIKSDIGENKDDFEKLYNTISMVSKLVNNEKLQVYYEVPNSKNWIEITKNTIKLLAEYNSSNQNNISYKIRCGGVKPEMTPPNENVIAAIMTCTKYNVSLKATAGLHHPFRHFNDELGGVMHGFVNIFVAIILSKNMNLRTELMLELLNDENPINFEWNDNGLTWQNHFISIEDIKESKDIISSFGSCSFDEPIDDLKELNIL